MGEINSLIINVRYVSYSPVIEMTAGKYHAMGLHYSQTITTHKISIEDLCLKAWCNPYYVLSLVLLTRVLEMCIHCLHDF